VAKNDPNMPNLNQKQILFSFALMLHFYVLLFVVLAYITKKGEIEREMCPWAISKVFW
jgi:cytochrome bd-type quinol oxidase subunit 1